MNTPPIDPTAPTSGAPAGEDPSQQAQNDLDQIQQINQQIEQALADGASPATIEALVKKLQKPMNDLGNLAPQLPPSERQMINNAYEQYQSFSQEIELTTPSAIALFQGACDTVSQLISAPSGANINAQALYGSKSTL